MKLIAHFDLRTGVARCHLRDIRRRTGEASSQQTGDGCHLPRPSPDDKPYSPDPDGKDSRTPLHLAELAQNPRDLLQGMASIFLQQVV